MRSGLRQVGLFIVFVFGSPIFDLLLFGGGVLV